MAQYQQTTERGFDRLVNFSDAVVAIAITLLVLPLVDLVGDGESLGALELVQEHALSFAAFFVTFLVTMIFWLRHHSLFELIADYDHRLLWLNGAWLLGIVLFPFASGLINVGGFRDGAGLMYCGIMAMLSVIQALISLHVRAQPELWATGAAFSDFHPGWAWIYASYFGFVALISLPYPDQASYLMLGLILLGMVRDRATRREYAAKD